MKTAVRYYSRSGNTKAIAETIAQALNTEAVSVDLDKAKISEEVDMIFIGGALYAYGLDENLNKYFKEVDGSKIKKAAAFSSTWISKHSIDLIKNALRDKGIDVIEDYLNVRGKPNKKALDNVREFALKYSQ